MDGITKPRKPLRVMFACNDYRNGMFYGRFDSVAIDKYEAEFDGPWTSIKFLDGNRVRIGRKVFEHTGVAEWVGNWCWDEVRVVDGKRLLRHLKDRGFTCSAGHTRLFNWFNERQGAKR